MSVLLLACATTTNQCRRDDSTEPESLVVCFGACSSTTAGRMVARCGRTACLPLHPLRQRVVCVLTLGVRVDNSTFLFRDHPIALVCVMYPAILSVPSHTLLPSGEDCAHIPQCLLWGRCEPKTFLVPPLSTTTSVPSCRLLFLSPLVVHHQQFVEKLVTMLLLFRWCSFSTLDRVHPSFFAVHTHLRDSA